MRMISKLSPLASILAATFLTLGSGLVAPTASAQDLKHYAALLMFES